MRRRRSRRLIPATAGEGLALGLGALGAVVALIVILARGELLFPESPNAPPNELWMVPTGAEEGLTCANRVAFDAGRQRVEVTTSSRESTERLDAYVRLRSAVPLNPLPSGCVLTRHELPPVSRTIPVTLTTEGNAAHVIELPSLDRGRVTFAVDVDVTDVEPSRGATLYEWELVVAWRDQEERLTYETVVPVPR